MKSILLSVITVLLIFAFEAIPSITIVDIENEYIEHVDNEDNINNNQLNIKEPSIEICNRWGIKLTNDEIDMLADIMFLEAHTESDESMIASIEVVFNRIAHDMFPNTLEDVLSQTNPIQFSTWENRHLAEPTDREYELINAVLYGETEVLSNDYVYFGRGKQNNNDPILIDNHWFCKC